jgi:uncharacterized protein YjcR
MVFFFRKKLFSLRYIICKKIILCKNTKFVGVFFFLPKQTQIGGDGWWCNMGEKYVLAEKDYVKGMKYKDIAIKYEVSLNTVKSWKKRYGWSRKKGAPKRKGMHPKQKGAPKGNINAKGNKGNKNATPPKRNTNAMTHGLFSKWLNDDAKEIMQIVSEQSPADILWQNIEIQYTAIIRAQQIMWVDNADDHLKEESSSSYSDMSSSESYKVSFAYERYDSFLKSQSRAMSELRSLIKQFISIADEVDERRIKLDIMNQQMEKIKAETEKVKAETNTEGDMKTQTVIVTGEEEMRRILASKKASEQNGV